jgi:hypothetical protein
MMNKWQLFHLKEARSELNQLIQQVEQGAVLDEALEAAVQHLYHHLNTAWNSRQFSSDRAYQQTDAEFNDWRQFPTDIEMGDQ